MVAALSLALALALPSDTLSVETASCARAVLDVEAFVVQLALELTPEDVVRVGLGDGARVRIRSSCAEPLLDLVLWSPAPSELTGDRLTAGAARRATVEVVAERAVDLRAVDGALRARTLALVVAEAWRSRARAPTILAPGAVVSDGPSAPPSAPPAATKGDTSGGDARPPAVSTLGPEYTSSPATITPRTEPGAPALAAPLVERASATLALGPLVRSFPASDTTLVGARLLGTLALRSWLDLGLDADASTGVVSHPIGEVRVAVFGGGLLALGQLELGPLTLGLGPRVSVGWAHVWGSSTKAAVATANGGSVVVMLGARVTAALPLGQSWSVALALDASGVAQGLLARADADVVATVDGLELGGTLALRWRAY